MKKTLLALLWVVSICSINAQSPFGTKQIINSNTGSFPRAIESGHLNNDNFPDIVVGTDLGGTIEWYKNNGNGTFTLQPIVSTSLPRINAVAIADIDGDNDNDIVAVSYSGSQAVWFENNESGNFGSAQLVAGGVPSANDVKAGDIDNNGTIDVVVSSYANDLVTWYSNDGSGNFGSVQIVADIANSGPLSIDLGDHNNDGDLDVVVAYGLVDAIILFENNQAQTGSATFTLDSNLVDSNNYGLRDVSFGDINNDGDLEIVMADQYQNPAWYNKSGGGSYTKTVFTTSNSSPGSVIVGDLNQNNTHDIIVGYASSTTSTDRLTLFPNSANSETTIDSSQNDIYGMTLADFDNDGDLDLATVSSGQNQLNWFRNGGGTSCDPALEGTACNDGDDCTVNDVYDADCNCAGILADSDNDGVCDAEDQCPGFDDNIDTNNNGVPDGCESSGCDDYTGDFAQNPLTHSGSGSNATTFNFPASSQDVSFSISNINEKLKGKASSKYRERVTVTYINGSGSSQTHGTYNGGSVSSANVSISGTVQSVTVTLSNSYSSSTSSTMSISMSSISYCSDSAPCAADSDGDGVCDADDQCPGFDDNIDTNNNGIPDGCESSGCQDATSSFPADPLTSSGSLVQTTSLNLPAGSQDVSFSVTDIGQKLKGKESSKYIEEVRVSYVDGSGSNQVYGTYRGNAVSSASVNISGSVQSITLRLSDAYSGRTTSRMSVNPSTVSYCVDSSQARSLNEKENSAESRINDEIPGNQMSVKVYPNPASHTLYIKLNSSDNQSVSTSLYNISGQMVRQLRSSISSGFDARLDVSGLSAGLYLLRVADDSGQVVETERIIIR